MEIKLMITDFDGTLVDTFEANYHAYAKAFEMEGRFLSREKYRECFGFRFDDFMAEMEITDSLAAQRIREYKGKIYPRYFDCLRVNDTLLSMLRDFRKSGGKTAIASTAREKNLQNALKYIGAEKDFDLILAGESVRNGKPDPEIYLTVLKQMNVAAHQAIVYEDSDVGFKAAEAAGIPFVRITL